MAFMRFDMVWFLPPRTDVPATRSNHLRGGDIEAAELQQAENALDAFCIVVACLGKRAPAILAFLGKPWFLQSINRLLNTKV